MKKDEVFKRNEHFINDSHHDEVVLVQSSNPAIPVSERLIIIYVMCIWIAHLFRLDEEVLFFFWDFKIS